MSNGKKDNRTKSGVGVREWAGPVTGDSSVAEDRRQLQEIVASQIRIVQGEYQSTIRRIISAAKTDGLELSVENIPSYQAVIDNIKQTEQELVRYIEQKYDPKKD